MPLPTRCPAALLKCDDSLRSPLQGQPSAVQRSQGSLLSGLRRNDDREVFGALKLGVVVIEKVQHQAVARGECVSENIPDSSELSLG